MAKDDRSGVNPFTGKKHFDIVNDDKFLQQSYNEYYAMINQSQLLDNTPTGQAVIKVALNLINAVQDYLSKIGRLDYVENYYNWDVHLVANDVVNAFCMPGGKIVMFSGSFSITIPSFLTGMQLMLNPQSLKMLLTGRYPGSSTDT